MIIADCSTADRCAASLGSHSCLAALAFPAGVVARNALIGQGANWRIGDAAVDLHRATRDVTKTLVRLGCAGLPLHAAGPHVRTARPCKALPSLMQRARGT